MLTVEINLKTIEKNLLRIKKKLPSKTKICAVVKADAYGLGCAKIAAAIERTADCFGVAAVSEGKQLRDLGIKKDILVFGVTGDIKTAAENNLIITIGSAAEAAAVTDKPVRIHIAVNTGMNRWGCNSVLEFLSIMKLLPDKRVEGLYTHFAFETHLDNTDKLDRQLKKFQKYRTLFRKTHPNAIIHAAASGTIHYVSALKQTNMVRIGKAIYGGIDGMLTAITVKSKIRAVKKIKTGDGIGYDAEWTATEPTIVGVVTGGYADGIQSRFTGASFVTVDNIVCKIIGRVCMDCFFIDVSEIKKPLWKTVTIISNKSGQTLMDVYKKTGVIACEILCGFSKIET
jgi:alanine racemase